MNQLCLAASLEAYFQLHVQIAELFGETRERNVWFHDVGDAIVSGSLDGDPATSPDHNMLSSSTAPRGVPGFWWAPGVGRHPTRGAAMLAALHALEETKR